MLKKMIEIEFNVSQKVDISEISHPIPSLYLLTGKMN